MNGLLQPNMDGPPNRRFRLVHFCTSLAAAIVGVIAIYGSFDSIASVPALGLAHAMCSSSVRGNIRQAFPVTRERARTLFVFVPVMYLCAHSVLVIGCSLHTGGYIAPPPLGDENHVHSSIEARLVRCKA